jgi:hypothetical protein
MTGKAVTGISDFFELDWLALLAGICTMLRDGAAQRHRIQMLGVY